MFSREVVKFFTKLFFLFNLFYLTSFAKNNGINSNEIDEIDLYENNKLTTVSNDYFYSSTYTVGLSFGCTNFLKYDIKELSEPNLNDMRFGLKPNIGGIRGSYNILFSNSFFAKGLGVFPRFGIDVDLKGYNVLNRFWASSPINLVRIFGDIGILFINIGKKIGGVLFKRCCSCGGSLKYYKPKLKLLNRPEFVFNTHFTFEPETTIFTRFRLTSQIGIGPSLINLYRKTTEKLILADTDLKEVDNKLYNYIFDIGFSFKMILKVAITNNFLNAFHFEFGYNYNPILLNIFLNNNSSIIDGGLWNFFLSINYARNMNVGLETVDFFDSKLETSIDKSILKETIFDREENKKDTIFLDCGIGIGQWIDVDSDRELKRNICPMLQCSFMMPYFGKKFGEHHYLSFIGLDVNEDLYTGKYHNGEHNPFFGILNNLSVSYNF